MKTTEKLDQLDDYQAQKTVLELDKQALIDGVLTPEIKKAIADIDAEFADKSAAVDENIAKLVDEIKADVLQIGSTVKGAHNMAVWNKGRVSWDTKALDAVLALHPELAPFRKEGEPSITIRKV